MIAILTESYMQNFFFHPLQYIIPETIELAMKVEYRWYIRCLMWEMFDIRWMLSIYTHHYFGRV